jgi:hypothetical protein
MADETVVAAEVLADSGTLSVDGTLGATVTAGQTVYLDTTTNTYKLADANASALTAVTAGIALNGGVSGQPVKVAIAGTLDPGFTVGVGEVYVQSATAGGIAPRADLTSGWYTVVLGMGITASQMKLVGVIGRAGVAKA